MAVLAATVCAVLTVLVRNVRGSAHRAVLVQKTGTNPAVTPEDSPIRSMGENLYVNFGRERWQPYHPRPQAPPAEEGKGGEVQQLADEAVYEEDPANVQEQIQGEGRLLEGQRQEGEGGQHQQEQGDGALEEVREEGKEEERQPQQDEQEGVQSYTSSNALLEETI